MLGERERDLDWDRCLSFFGDDDGDDTLVLECDDDLDEDDDSERGLDRDRSCFERWLRFDELDILIQLYNEKTKK